MVLEKKIIEINSTDQKIESSGEIKQALDRAIIEQKKVHKLMNLFILALFFIFALFMLG
jgi:hypothetical protein